MNASLDQRSIPQIDYPEELPITAHRESLVRMIREHQVIVVRGETGSGKSTQLPKFCLEAGLGRRGMIGHTQPRRLAARSIAGRIAEELGTAGDARVAYKVRFGDQTSPDTLIKLMTDGILLAETQSDRDLRAYDAFIIDEAHERSLNIDFLLAYLHGVLRRRPELRLIITSATIDAERFAEHFADDGRAAPIVSVEGRGYPVEVRYLPWTAASGSAEHDEDDHDLARHVIAGIDEACGAGGGDILVFLPTERDIREVSHAAAGHFKRLGLAGRIDILPLYARLPQAEQQRIFHPTGKQRRIVLATNVAESSLTVPGIRYVVDAGTARISRFSPRSRVQRLPIEPVSRSSCDQRKGRCGRVAAGVCVRLYSQADYESRDAFTTPEIRRTNLAAVILRTLALRLGRLDQLPLLDPPRPDAIRQGYRTLRELGAIDAGDELTEIGRRLGQMPVDPRVGRMILAGEEFGVLPEILVIAAALEVQDPRVRPPERQQAADEAHSQFAHGRSDFLGLLKLWRFYQRMRTGAGRSKLDRICRAHYLSPQRMREWTDVYRQLLQLVSTSRRGRVGSIRYSEDEDEVVDKGRYTTIHQALLAGLLSGIAMLGDRNEYTGAGGLKLFLWPGSGVFGNKPKWIVAAELVETTRQYGRVVAAVQPEWIEPLAGHLVKRQYSDPHWSRKSAAAFCYEQVTLFGLPIVSRRRLPLAKIDPPTARQLLIEDGLAGELSDQDSFATKARFVRFNRRLIALIGELAARTRNRQWVVDPLAVRDFYASRLPEFVCDRVSLERYDRDVPMPPWTHRLGDAAALAGWLGSPPQDRPAVDQGEPGRAEYPTPYMRPEDLLPQSGEQFETEDFPEELVVGQTRLPLQYHFQPGDASDGIRITVPRRAIAQLSDQRLGWLVPGLLQSKLVAMIKALPKRIRRNLVPTAEVAQRVAAELMPHWGQVPFMPAVCEALSRQAEMPVTAADFSRDKMDPHLDFLVEVVDDDGRSLAVARGLEAARAQAGVDAGDMDAPAPVSDAAWARDSMTSFEIEQLPEQVTQARGGVHVAQFPGLVDLGDAVAVCLFSDVSAAEASTRRGATRLFALAQQKELRSQVRHLPGLADAQLRLASILPTSELQPRLVELLARRSFVDGQPMLRSDEQFQRLRSEAPRRIAAAACDLAAWLPALADAFHAARSGWESLPQQDHSGILADVRKQVDLLLFPGFLAVVPWQWLAQYPRYLRAIAYRVEKWRSAASRDAEAMRLVSQLTDRWLASVAEHQRTAEGLAENEVRWMLEELRVSLFAQPLGTSIKVSPQRIEKQLATATRST